MGLDTSHNCWHGPYSTFRRFRYAIAKAAEWPMAEAGDGFGEDYVLPNDMLAENYKGVWAETPADPLLIFLGHSDCDGVILAKHTGLVADRLEQLLPKVWPNKLDDWPRRLQQFIDGLRDAAAKNEDVHFG